jgi:branched-chain amino acid transport system substrate-binding protein
MKVLKSISFLIILIFLVISCGLNNNKNSIKIGALLPLTGGGANYGKSLKQGIELAVKDINSSGGINGKILQIIFEDSKSNAKDGVSAFCKLITVNKVPLVLGSISSVILAVQPIADENKVLLINSSAISPKICEKADNFLFSLMVNGETEAKFMAQEFCKKYPNEKISVLYSNNSSGKDTKDKFIKELEIYGGKIATSEGYELNTTDFKSHLNNIKKSNSKFTYLIAFSSNEFANILIQSKEIGLATQWYSYSGIETKETLELAKNAANNVIYSYPKYNPEDTLFSSFQTKYRNKYNSWADIYTVTSYDGIKFIAQVIKEYGTTSFDIQKGLRCSKNYKGIFGNITFESKQCVEKELFWKMIKNENYIIK